MSRAFKVGQRVEVEWNLKTWSKGTVIAVNAQDTLFIIFDEGHAGAPTKVMFDAMVAHGLDPAPFAPPSTRMGCTHRGGPNSMVRFLNDEVIFIPSNITVQNYVGKCETCDDRNEYCAPNLPDNKWQCYSCRQNPYRRVKVAS